MCEICPDSPCSSQHCHNYSQLSVYAEESRLRTQDIGNKLLAPFVCFTSVLPVPYTNPHLVFFFPLANIVPGVFLHPSRASWCKFRWLEKKKTVSVGLRYGGRLTFFFSMIRFIVNTSGGEGSCSLAETV